MSNIDPPASWADIDGINTNERLLGGPSGPLNRAVTGLTARTKQLREDFTALTDSTGAQSVGFQRDVTAIAGSVSQILRRTPATPEEYGARADGSDDAPAILAMLTAASAGGFSCQLQPGRTYYVSTINAQGLSIVLDGNGGKIVRLASAANNTAFEIFNQLVDRTSVTSVVNTTYTFPGDGNLSDVTAITTDTPLGVSVGDIVKIVSDDINPGSALDSNERIGESFQVGAVDGNIIYTVFPLSETYTTNVRVAKMVRRTLSLQNLDISDQAGYPANRNTPLLRVTGYVQPFLSDVYVHDGASYGFVHRSCHETRTVNFRAERLRTSPGNSAYGYGMHELGCVRSNHAQMTGSRCRHLWTSGTLSTSEGSTLLYNYGGAIDATIHGGSAADTENAPWDTHSDSLRTRFENCLGVGKQSGVGNSRYQYQLRGRDDQIVNCASVGYAAAYLQGPRSGSARFMVQGLKHTTPPSVTLPSPVLTITGDAANPLYVELQADVSCGPEAAISATNCEIRGSLKATYGRGANGYSLIRLNTNAKFIGNLVADLSGATGTNPRVLGCTAASASARLSSLEVIRGTQAEQWYVGDLNSADGRITIAQLECDVRPSTSNGGFINPGAGSVRFVEKLRVNGSPVSEGVGALANSSTTLNVWSPLTQILDVPLTAARTVTLPSGSTAQPGRTMKFIRTASATGASAMDIGGVVTLAAPGDVRSIVWTGTAWIPA